MNRDDVTASSTHRRDVSMERLAIDISPREFDGLCRAKGLTPLALANHIGSSVRHAANLCNGRARIEPWLLRVVEEFAP